MNNNLDAGARKPPASRAASTTDSEAYYVSSTMTADAAAASDSSAMLLHPDKFTCRLRSAVIFLLLACAVLVSCAIYFVVSASETRAFEVKFHADAQTVLDAVGRRLDETVGVTDTFVTHLTSHARYNSQGGGWPFVTLPGFAVHARKLLRLSRAFHFAIYPAVSRDQKQQWEGYSDENGRAWVDESIEVQANDDSYTGPIIRDYTVSPVIMGVSGPVSDDPPDAATGVFLPSWQQAPVVPMDRFPPYNFDAWDAAPMAILHAALQQQQQQRFVIGNFGNVVFHPPPDNPMQVAFTEANRYWMQSLAGPDNPIPLEPTSVIAYPIYDYDVAANNTIAGVLVYTLFWRELLVNVLPQDSVGVVVVLKHTCGEAFTYQLDGSNNGATFVGVGDLHDPSYSHLAYSALLSDLLHDSSYYSGLPLSETYCPKTLTVYASAEMQSVHSTNNAMYLTIATAAIFVFAAILFIAYDCLARRRQRVVLSSQIRHELAAARENNVKGGGDGSNSSSRKFDTEEVTGSDTALPVGLPPTAEVYVDTTILCADLVGFAKWSQRRTPGQVFELLELVCSSFDEIAGNHNVLRVDTPGDSFVAATGIPTPQSDHAVRMVRFARDCFLIKGLNLLQSLKKTLGDDTGRLSFRVGLSSGSATAGILRAVPRFHLFGETAAIASRMCSASIKGRLHVSEATATELEKAGKSHWCVERADIVLDEGNNEIQTYWVEVKSGRKGIPGAAFVDPRSLQQAGLLDDEDVDHQIAKPPPPSIKPPAPKTPVAKKVAKPEVAVRELTEGAISERHEVAANINAGHRLVAVPANSTLGIVIESLPLEEGGPLLDVETVSGGARICAVEESSALNGLVFPGEVIMEFDGIDTTKMNATDLFNLVANSGGMSERETVMVVASAAAANTPTLLADAPMQSLLSDEEDLLTFQQQPLSESELIHAA